MGCCIAAVFGAQSMLAAVNGARREMGVGPLCLSGSLCTIAQSYAGLQAYTQDGGHYANNTDPSQRLADYPGAVENLISVSDDGSAYTALGLLNITDGTQYSSLMGSACTHLGVGQALDDEASTYYWVIVPAAIPDVPCNADADRLNILAPKMATAARSQNGPLAAIISPPTIEESTAYEVSTDGETETVVTTNRTMIDTFPRIDQNGWMANATSPDVSAIGEYLEDPFGFIEQGLQDAQLQVYSSYAD